MHRLQAVAHVGQRAADDHAHRVIEIAPPHLVGDRDRLEFGRLALAGLVRPGRGGFWSAKTDTRRISGKRLGKSRDSGGGKQARKRIFGERMRGKSVPYLGWAKALKAPCPRLSDPCRKHRHASLCPPYVAVYAGVILLVFRCDERAAGYLHSWTRGRAMKGTDGDAPRAVAMVRCRS